MKRLLLTSLLLLPLISCGTLRGFFEGTETQPSQASTLSTVLKTVLPAPFGEAGGLLIALAGLFVTSKKKEEKTT